MAVRHHASRRRRVHRPPRRRARREVAGERRAVRRARRAPRTSRGHPDGHLRRRRQPPPRLRPRAAPGPGPTGPPTRPRDSSTSTEAARSARPRRRCCRPRTPTTTSCWSARTSPATGPQALGLEFPHAHRRPPARGPAAADPLGRRLPGGDPRDRDRRGPRARRPTTPSRGRRGASGSPRAGSGSCRSRGRREFAWPGPWLALLRGDRAAVATARRRAGSPGRRWAASSRTSRRGYVVARHHVALGAAGRAPRADGTRRGARDRAGRRGADGARRQRAAPTPAAASRATATSTHEGTFSNPHSDGHDLTLIEAEVVDELGLPPAEARAATSSPAASTSTRSSAAASASARSSASAAACASPAPTSSASPSPGILRDARPPRRPARGRRSTDGAIRVGDSVEPLWRVTRRRGDPDDDRSGRAIRDCATATRASSSATPTAASARRFRPSIGE